MEGFIRIFTQKIEYKMNFIDEADIYIKAGDGGQGCVSFRREKYVPRGGPDGGDGGAGGSVILKVDTGLNTLHMFRHKRKFIAEKGVAGRKKNQHGRAGRDLVIKVPQGTVVRDVETGLLLADLTMPGQKWVAARGGKGGKGNARFATSTNQVPRYAQPGLPGQERTLRLELKLLADVGLVGAPNAGKSTLLSRVSAAKPKVADYPFTTLVPHLGVVELSDERSFVMADIPGLIEGAHAGAGMGTDFLKHVERTEVLLHMIDASLGADAAIATYDMICAELKGFDSSLMDKAQLIALNKMDIVSEQEMAELEGRFMGRGLETYRISAYTGQGLEPLLEQLYHLCRGKQ